MITRTTNKPRFPELRGALEGIQFPAWAERKYDGEFNWFIKNGECYLLNKHGKKRTDCAVTQLIDSEIGTTIQLIGELFYDEGKAGALYELLKNKNSGSLHYRPFDIVEYDGENLIDKPLITRKEILHSLFPALSAPGKVCQDAHDVVMYFNDAVKDGYEGIVVKNMVGRLVFGPCSWVKMKKKDESNFKVISIDPVRERIEVEVKLPAGIRPVGVKVSNKEKTKLRVGSVVAVQYQSILSHGGLRHPVFVKLIRR